MAVHEGRIKALWIVATNPAASMPRAGRVRQALAACPVVVVSDCWPTETTALAKVVLPAAGWGEKDGTVTNSERRISRQRAFLAAPGEARPDWWMLAQVARRMGWPEAFAWSGPAEIFREHAALSAFENDGTRVFDLGALASLDRGGYDRLDPVQWPLRAGTEGGGRLFADGRFPTASSRARFVPTPVATAEPVGAPFLLNTGRVRDQWHTMTRTGRVARLLDHTPEPQAAMAPADALRLGIEPGDFVRVGTSEASITLAAMPDPAQRPGEVFVPMHWGDAFSSGGPVARLVSDACDPVSGQPALKATPVSLERVPVAWRGLLLHRRLVALPSGIHWSRVPVETGHAFTLCGTELAQGLAARLLDCGGEVIELADPSRGVWRYAAVLEGRLEAWLFLTVGAGAELPARQGLAGMLGRLVQEDARLALLAGRTSARNPAGPTVCSCFSVGLSEIRQAIVRNGARDPAAIGALLGAGTNCGSCLPELKRLLREATAAAA